MAFLLIDVRTHALIFIILPGLHLGHVLQAVLAGSTTVLRASRWPRKTRGWGRIY